MPAVFQMPETIASESLTDGGGKEIFLLFLTVPAAAVLIYICLRKIRRYISGREKNINSQEQNILSKRPANICLQVN